MPCRLGSRGELRKLQREPSQLGGVIFSDFRAFLLKSGGLLELDSSQSRLNICHAVVIPKVNFFIVPGMPPTSGTVFRIAGDSMGPEPA